MWLSMDQFKEMKHSKLEGDAEGLYKCETHSYNLSQEIDIMHVHRVF